MPLPAPTIVYNGYAFNASTLTTELKVEPEYDEPRRTVVYSKYRITLKTIIAGQAIDGAVRAIVQRLNRPACPFVYFGTGLGFALNIGQIRDASWGPKPQGCSVKPLGGGNSVELTWTVEGCVQDCPDAIFRGMPMEYVFSLKFTEDDGGYTTRGFDGFLRIPMTRHFPNDRTLPDSVDFYREEICPPIADGCRRQSSTFTISTDKRQLSFSIVDVQLGQQAPPPGCVHAKLSHNFSNPPGKLRIWNQTISGEYEVAMPEYRRSGFVAARTAFFNALRDRINLTMTYLRIQNLPGPPNPNVNGSLPPARLDNQQSGVIVPQVFTVEEPDAYGKPVVKLSCTYMVANARLSDMLAASGVCRPLPDSNYQLWVASLGSTFGPRGHAGFVFTPGEDAIVDNCGPSTIPLLRTQPFRELRSGIALPTDIFPDPTPDASWILWENNFKVEADNGTIPVQTLRSIARDLPLVGGLFGEFQNTLIRDPALPNVPPPDGIPWKLPTYDKFFTPSVSPEVAAMFGGKPQQRKQGAYVFMYGRAVRVGYAIEPPRLYRWGQVTVTPANRKDCGEGFVAGPIGDVGVAVWGARWLLRYWIPELPQGADLPVSQPPMSKP